MTALNNLGNRDAAPSIRNDFRPVVGSEDRRWLRWLDGEIFPDDKPLVMSDAQWSLVWEWPEAVAFCGWCRRGDKGFHYRAGVHESARGQGLQKAMIAYRERAMVAAGLKTAVTYTEAFSAASMRSLIASGYRPFEATLATGLVINPAYWRTMVYWRKDMA